MMRRDLAVAVAAAVFLFSCLGCGGGTTFPAGGRVTFPNGSPLAGGAVEFRSLEHEPPVGARGVIREDGTFQLTTYRPGDGAVEGEHQALVVPKRPAGDQWDEVRISGQAPIIDSKYQSFDTSGLTFTVTRKAADNQFQITVTPPY